MEFEIDTIPTEADYVADRDRVIQDGAFRSLQSQLMDKERERFKVDALVNYVRGKDHVEEVGAIVRSITRLMSAGRLRFPKHAPIDAAYALIRDGDVVG